MALTLFHRPAAISFYHDLALAFHPLPLPASLTPFRDAMGHYLTADAASSGPTAWPAILLPKLPTAASLPAVYLPAASNLYSSCGNFAPWPYTGTLNAWANLHKFLLTAKFHPNEYNADLTIATDNPNPAKEGPVTCFQEQLFADQNLLKQPRILFFSDYKAGLFPHCDPDDPRLIRHLKPYAKTLTPASFTSRKPGKFLKEHFSATLTDPVIAALAARHAAEFTPPTLHIAERIEDILWAYENGPSSCMSGDKPIAEGINPIAAYEGEFHLAYLKKDSHCTARCLLHPATKSYSRIYGDSERLKLALSPLKLTDAWRAFEATRRHNFIGATLKAIPSTRYAGCDNETEDGCFPNYLIPFGDGFCYLNLEADGKRFRIVHRDDWQAPHYRTNEFRYALQNKRDKPRSYPHSVSQTAPNIFGGTVTTIAGNQLYPYANQLVAQTQG